jgi:hypothetical protein
MAGSSHPYRHGQWSEQEATFRSRARLSRRMNTRDTTTAMVATAAATHQQHSAATATVAPPGAGPEDTLEVARQLLHNPYRPACYTIGSRAVAPICRPAHHHYYQHTASRRAASKPIWWGASAINGTLVLTDCTACAVGSTRNKSRYGRFAS